MNDITAREIKKINIITPIGVNGIPDGCYDAELTSDKVKFSAMGAGFVITLIDKRRTMNRPCIVVVDGNQIEIKDGDNPC